LTKKKIWITLGILTSCKLTAQLSIACRNSDNPDHIKLYKRDCEILSVVIREAKKIDYPKLTNP
jgi:hypothetical protein